MWDGGWDGEPPRGGDRPGNGAPEDGAPEDGAPGNGAPGNGAPGNGAPEDGAPGNGAPVGAARPDAPGVGGWPADDLPQPRRWYSPATQRGKVILVVTVAVVALVLLIGCCVGLGGLGELRRIDMTGFI